MNIDESLKYYRISCDGGDKYGCEGHYELVMNMCYLKEQKKYCGILEPREEFKILAFLEDLDEKYIDCFVNHNFSYSFSHEKTETLFQQRLKGNNKLFLKALEKGKKGKFYDGDGAETLDSYIRIFHGGPFIRTEYNSSIFIESAMEPWVLSVLLPTHRTLNLI